MTQDPEDTRPLSHGQVCYLQLPAADRRRAAAFYETVFGWETGEHYPDFESPGLIGEWVEGRAAAPDAGPVVWLAVTDMDEVSAWSPPTAAGSSSRPPPTARTGPSPRSPIPRATPSAWPPTRRIKGFSFRRTRRGKSPSPPVVTV